MYTHPRDEILATIERIYRNRMTTTSGGNLSIREENGDIWITPARIDKGSLRRDDIVLVRAGGAVQGHHPPSSELPFHREIYAQRPDVRGIVHAHPVALVAFSVVGKTPDTHLFHQARQVCGEAGFAPYQLPGSLALGRNVAQTFHRGFDCVILENHGVVTVGRNLPEAFHRFETLEFTAKTIIKASHLGPIHYLSEEDIALAGQREATNSFDTPHLPHSEELELRRKLCEFIQRAYRQRLFISTQGSFSARLDEGFLITPYRVDRGMIEASDLVLVRDGAAEPGKQASRAASMHQAIYRRQAHAGAIINAYPVNATAFSVTGAELDSRTIPESYIVLRTVNRLRYGLQFQDVEEIAAGFTADRPVALLENDGVLVAGRDVLDAFDKLEVLESTAEALINSRPLGALAAMPDAVIEELERVFLK
ncbi:MAG: class II aldolase/adducin family protein [Bryobacterales bacterium]|nr:class II aldolase/adducin family protein [Bryobacterales bacterium]